MKKSTGKSSGSVRGDAQGGFIFVPLGGTGEIGMNFNLYGCDGAWLAVDCGMGFSGPDSKGFRPIEVSPGGSSPGGTGRYRTGFPSYWRKRQLRTQPSSACESQPTNPSVSFLG